MKDDVIYCPNINPITIWHQCGKNAPEDRKYTKLGFPNYFKDGPSFKYVLEESIKKDTIL